MVEFALVILPLLAIFGAIMDYGFAFWIRTSLQNAVREGTRYAVTYQLKKKLDGTTACHADSIKQVVWEYARAVPGGQKLKDRTFVRFYDPATFTEVNKNVPGNIVEVSVEDYEWRWMIPIWRPSAPFKIAVRSSDRMESLPDGLTPPCL